MQLSVWTNCENNLLQKRATRLIMDADSKASFVRFFDDLSWLPFYEKAKISKCLIAFKVLQGESPAQIVRLLTRNNDLHRLIALGMQIITQYAPSILNDIYICISIIIRIV